MTSTRTVNLVVGFLGLTLIVLVGGIILLSWQEKPIDDALKTLAATNLGALGALLVSTRSVDPPPTPEEVSEPVT